MLLPGVDIQVGICLTIVTAATEPTPTPALVTCKVTATGQVVLSGARISEGEGVEQQEMLGETESVRVWEGGLEDVPWVLGTLVGAVSL
jgi:hypothetical protein